MREKPLGGALPETVRAWSVEGIPRCGSVAAKQRGPAWKVKGLQRRNVGWVHSSADWSRDVNSRVTVYAPRCHVLLSGGSGAIALQYPSPLLPLAVI